MCLSTLYLFWHNTGKTYQCKCFSDFTLTWQIFEEIRQGDVYFTGYLNSQLRSESSILEIVCRYFKWKISEIYISGCTEVMRQVVWLLSRCSVVFVTLASWECKPRKLYWYPSPSPSCPCHSSTRAEWMWSSKHDHLSKYLKRWLAKYLPYYTCIQNSCSFLKEWHSNYFLENRNDF